MRQRIFRLVVVATLVFPTYAAAQGLQCDAMSGGFWPFGSLSSWCTVIRGALCALGY